MRNEGRKDLSAVTIAISKEDVNTLLVEAAKKELDRDGAQRFRDYKLVLLDIEPDGYSGYKVTLAMLPREEKKANAT